MPSFPTETERDVVLASGLVAINSTESPAYSWWFFGVVAQ